jgi:predicted nuclease of restriction endonuclease-like (RecB) superfamily
MQFDILLTTLTNLHTRLSQQAARQTDQLMTLRNWLFGLYIVEFEQNGEDRAAYGNGLIKRLSADLQRSGMKGMADRTLRLYRQFYLKYPQIWQSLIAKSFVATNQDVIQTEVGKLVSGSNALILQTAIAKSSDSATSLLELDINRLLDRLTFTHFVELLKVDNLLYRRFYEVEAIKNNWSVRELNRAVTTLLAERTGLSTDKATVIARVKDDKPVGLEDLIRNPYVLDFLGLAEKAAYSENEMETAIVDHLQDFLLELGRGFCFEARQKRITFDNRHYRIDLVFYHRVLKCHVLIDLKIGEFDHADAGQMNVYLNYYKDNELTEGDNPPVGIILCASKNDALVKYATSGMAQDMFVSRYLTELPNQEQLQAFIQRESQLLP